MATLTAIIVADFTTALASELAIGGTSATLASATDDDGVALPSGRYFFTLDGSNSIKEHISCELSGTALTNIKTVTRQGVETAGALRKHRIGASVTITDFAHILQINNLVNGTTDLNASDPLKYDGTATINNDNQLATKSYVDSVAVAGAPDANTTTKGIVELATQAEVDAKTATGSTGASLVATPAVTRSTLLSDYKADTGAANAYVITPTPAISAYTAGQIFSFKTANSNTTASTLNVNGLGVKTIKKLGGTADLVSGDIAANSVVLVEYDGTNFQMLSPIANITTYVDFYGPGTDGDVTISSNTTLTRDMFYNNLTINSTFTLSTAGYRVFVKGTLTNNGTIANNGQNASGPTAGVGGAAGSVGAGGSGANSPGLNSGAGGGGGGVVIIYAKTVAVQGTITALGGNGGNGGVAGGSNVGTAATAPAKTLIQTGTGGKGGNATNAGGAATAVNPSTMSTIFLATTKMFFDFVAVSLLSGGVGGSSGAGYITTNDTGGGGGGQGGVIFFVYSTIVTPGTLTVAGGSGGSGYLAGLAGNAGSSGIAISVQY